MVVVLRIVIDVRLRPRRRADAGARYRADRSAGPGHAEKRSAEGTSASTDRRAAHRAIARLRTA
jgi:hypothetical protein